MGIKNNKIAETPVAIIDFETTGLTAGLDKVIEVSVMRHTPGEDTILVMDTLVNPLRPVDASWIHGITDRDVTDAPTFSDISGNLVDALSGSVVCSYNIYFDIKFLLSELQSCGINVEIPHFCLMYMRPTLNKDKKRCKLIEACKDYGIDYKLGIHWAVNDTIAATHLFHQYLLELSESGIETFADLAKRKKYKFTNSFEFDPLSDAATYNLKQSDFSKSRRDIVEALPPVIEENPIDSYWESLVSVITDLEVTDEELEYILSEKNRLDLEDEVVKSLHAKVFTSIISEYAEDNYIDDDESDRLKKLFHCLSKLGWAPGE